MREESALCEGEKEGIENLFEGDQSSGEVFPLSAAGFIVHNRSVWSDTSQNNYDYTVRRTQSLKLAEKL